MIDKLTGLIKHLLTKKEFRYLLAGGFSEVLEFVSFLILLPLIHQLYIANSISFAVGVISGFIFHKLWSFAGEHQYRTRAQFAGFIALGLFNFAATNIIVGFLVHGQGVWPPIAKLIGIAITVSWSYLIVNKIIFRHRQVVL